MSFGRRFLRTISPRFAALHGVVVLVPDLQLREGQRLRARHVLGEPLPWPVIAIGGTSVWP